MKRVVICSTRIAFKNGGVATITRLTAKALGRLGYDVHILTQLDDGKFTCENVRIFSHPSLAREMYEILTADIAICEGAVLRLCWPLLFIPKKCIVVKHGVNAGMGAVRRFFERWLSLNAKWAGVSQYVADREYLKTVVVPNACDPEIFNYNGEKKIYDLIYVGSLTEEKGVFVLLKAVEMALRNGLKINRLTMLGGGPEREKILEYSSAFAQKGCELVLTGNVVSDEVARHLRLHRILVAPSMDIKWQEAFALTPIEAMACGCDVIVSDSGGLPESAGGCGQVFPSGDAFALADQIERALKGDWKSDAEQKARHVEKYTPTSLIKAYFSQMGIEFNNDCVR